MPSLQARLLRPLLRVQRAYQGRMATAPIERLVKFRRRSDAITARLIRMPRGVAVEPETVAGVNGTWISHESAAADPVVIFIHGGGIFFGLTPAHRRAVALIARSAGVRVFAIQYRLNPGNPYPNAHDDCFAVYRELVGRGARLVLIGESSGGVLSLATLLRAKAAGLPQPRVCIEISPTVDFGFKDDRIWRIRDPFVHPRFVVEPHKIYVAGNDTSTPDLGPIYHDLSGLAPLHIVAGENELLAGEAARLEEAARRDGVPVEARYWHGMWHGWHLMSDQVPEGAAALAYIAGVVRAAAG